MNTTPEEPSPHQFERLSISPSGILQTLLKRPSQIIHELLQRRDLALGLYLFAFGLIGTGAYGLVVGSLTGGLQMLIAPAKLMLGAALAMLICLPSLYIFISLGGIDLRIKTVAGGLSGAICLSALLLIGFAPVAWIFSQSTDSIGFMGTLHLLFWLIGIGFGLRILRGLCRSAGGKANGHLRIWTAIFVLVCLQMTTTLRPIIARSDRFLPAEKKFFLAYWFESLTENGKSNRQPTP